MNVVLRLCFGCFKKLFLVLNKKPTKFFKNKWHVEKKVKNKQSKVWKQIAFNIKLKKQTPP